MHVNTQPHAHYSLARTHLRMWMWAGVPTGGGYWNWTRASVADEGPI